MRGTQPERRIDVGPFPIPEGRGAHDRARLAASRAGSLQRMNHGRKPQEDGEEGKETGTGEGFVQIRRNGGRSLQKKTQRTINAYIETDGRVEWPGLSRSPPERARFEEGHAMSRKATKERLIDVNFHDCSARGQSGSQRFSSPWRNRGEHRAGARPRQVGGLHRSRETLATKAPEEGGSEQSRVKLRPTDREGMGTGEAMAKGRLKVRDP